MFVSRVAAECNCRFSEALEEIALLPPGFLAHILEIRAFEATYQAMAQANHADDRKNYQTLVDTELGGLIFQWDADYNIPEEFQ